MPKSLLFDQTVIPILHRGLDAMALRQKAIAQNIANAQTFGYKRKLVKFEENLLAALEQETRLKVRCTDPDHLPLRKATERIQPVFYQADNRQQAGSEEITIEREMSDLAQTQMKYEAEAKLARRQIEILKMAIGNLR
ncbi:MAG: flagellar basal body rod protein FlgB [bacterium]